MRRSPGTARTRIASGRFHFLGLLLVVGCASPPPGGEPPPLQTVRDPVVEQGPISGGRAAQAARLFGEAREAFDAGRFASARRLAEQVVLEYPSSGVSGRALWLQAQAALEVGRLAEARRAARRYAELLQPGDARIAQSLLLQADAYERGGDQASRLETLLRIDADAPLNARLRGAEEAREAAQALDLEALERVVTPSAGDGPLAPVALAVYARLLMEADREDEARWHAWVALLRGAQGPDSLLSAAVLSGDLPGREGEARRVRIVTVLPVSGSPAMQEFASLVAEGIEVAAASALGEGFVVELDTLDDQGDPAVAAELARGLEGRNLAGAVGFLEDRSFAAATLARETGVPLVSPTARAVPAGEIGAYTLAGADPQAASSVARYAVETGIVRAAVIHSQAPESVAEADAIQATLEARGVPLVGRFAYDVGATFFSPQILGAQEALRGQEIRDLNLEEDDTLHVELLDSVALFLPIPPEDVEFLAPQVTHFGLDTLGIAVFGTSAWTDPQVLETVDTRHTNGVVATSPVDAGPGSRGRVQFRSAYEEHFQRSLVSPVPALGYDAALLLLEGVRTGGTSTGALRAAMGRIRDLQGATGVFSVYAGQVVRRTEIVRLDHGVKLPIG